MYGPLLMLQGLWLSVARWAHQNGAMPKVRKTKAGLNLKRWFKEDWRTLSGDKDYSKGDRTFRPTKRISKNTPVTAGELTSAEKARARKEKRDRGRVSRYRLKKKNR